MLALSALLVAVPERLPRSRPRCRAGSTALVVAHLYGLDLRIVAGAIAWSTAIVLVAAAVVALAGGL